jgi:hypothetical protein
MRPDDTVETVRSLLRSNFNRAYNTNRAPVQLTLDADFMTILGDNGGLEALELFLNEVCLCSV